MIGIWCMLVIAIMIVVTHSGADPRAAIPHSNWFIVCFGVAGYLVPRFFTHKHNTPPQNIAFGWLAAIFAIIMLFVAGNTYYDSVSHFRNIILVLAVQLQYIMCFVMVKTDYVAWASAVAKRVNGLKSMQPENEIYAPVVLVGLPMFLPLFVVFALTLARSR